MWFCAPQICTCKPAVATAQHDKAVAHAITIGVFSTSELLTTQDRLQVVSSYGKGLDFLMLHDQPGRSTAKHMARLQNLVNGYPKKKWLMLVLFESFVVRRNLIARLRALDSSLPIMVLISSDWEGPIEFVLSRALFDKLQLLVQTNAHQNMSFLQMVQAVHGTLITDPEMRYDTGQALAAAAMPTGAVASVAGHNQAADTCTPAAVLRLKVDLAELRPEFQKSEGGLKHAVAHYLLKGGEIRESCQASVR